MIKGRSWKKSISLMLGIMLFISITEPLNAASVRGTDAVDVQSISTDKQTPESKVSAKLTKQFKDSEYVSYIVKMKTQVDTGEVSAKAAQKMSLQKATPSAIKFGVRNAVVNSLRQTAETTQEDLESYLQQNQASGKVQKYKGYFIVNAMSVTSTVEVMESISKFSEVEKIEPDETRYLQDAGGTQTAAVSAPEAVEPVTPDRVELTPSIPAAGNQDENIEWNIKHIHAPEVWAKGIDGTGIVVANLDSGVDYTNPALQRKWRAMNASEQIVNPELSWYDAIGGEALPVDVDGHGTHTMGTMVGSEENGTNQIGVAPAAKWIAVRVFKDDSTTDSILLDGGEWIMAPKDKDGNLHPELAPDVVNNSWGGGSGINEFYRPMVQAWRDAQIFPEFSAGNVRPGNPGGPGSVANPANYPESFATGATDINDQLADFSLQGPSPYQEIKPEVSAPGVNIRSSVPGGYQSGWNGTSMAGPHTTALAALLLQANHSLTVDELEEVIMQSATPLTNREYRTVPNNGFGYGEIDALAAVNAVLDGFGSVSGSVTTDGNDSGDPVIEHKPVPYGFTGYEIPLSIHAKDDVSITKVSVFVRTQGDDSFTPIAVQRVDGDYKDGEYSAVIPPDKVVEPGIEYYIEISDFGNHKVTSDVYSIKVTKGWEPGVLQDFEDNVIGFSTGGNGRPWEWGVPVSGPGKAYSGEKVLATNLTGTYANYSDSYVITPPIDLTNSPKGAVLSFKQWYDLQNNVDKGTVYVASESTDNYFVPLASFTGKSDGWVTQKVDLSAYTGQIVAVAFKLNSDPYNTYEGWYLDDLLIYDTDDTAPGAPELSGGANPLGYVFLGWEPPADDDVKQYIVYRNDGQNEDLQPVGTATKNTFNESFTATQATYTYAVAAEDFLGNEGPLSNRIDVELTAPPSIYENRFDGDTDEDWMHSGDQDDWERGVPSSVISTPSSVWGTKLDGNYRDNADASLISPVISIPADADPLLVYDQWYNMEPGYDTGTVEITADGGANWTELLSYSGDSSGWNPVILPLAEYAGTTVQLRFHFKSDASANWLGWYIDNFRILDMGTGPAPENPSPGLSLAGIMKQDKSEEMDVMLQLKPSDVRAKGTEQVKALQSTAKASANATGLPVRTTITVLESGRSIVTDPATGSYKLFHKPGTYTLKAEAYGFYPQTKSVTITRNQNETVDFDMKAIPRGLVHGRITDEATGEPIVGAIVGQSEDAVVAPVRTDEDGRFSLDLIEGTYTLTADAQNYLTGQSSLTITGNSNNEISLALEPFVGYSEELAYDDGTSETGRALVYGNDAYAVRFTPAGEQAQIVGGSILFRKDDNTDPAGKTFKYAIYDTSGMYEAPGKLLAGPFDGTAASPGWTELKFNHPVQVKGDFYIVYIQPKDYNYNADLTPFVAFDKTLPYNRTWMRIDGKWKMSPEENGNAMFRAEMNYVVSAPVISSPSAESYTNKDEVTITGLSPAIDGTELKIYNGSKLASTSTIKGHKFEVPVTLNDGENIFTAEAVVLDKTTKRSTPHKVILDKLAPELLVTSPADQLSTNSDVLTVSGTVHDEYFKTLLINDQEVEISEDGGFETRIFIHEGSNTLTIKAVDLAGNETTVTRTVQVNRHLPKLTHILPAEDMKIKVGETVTIAFDSDAGLTASYKIELPMNVSKISSSDNSVPMIEVTPGHYEAVFKASASLEQGGIIVVTAKDQSGNIVSEQAPGKLFVKADTPTPTPTPTPNPPYQGGGGGGSAPVPTPTPSVAPSPSPTPETSSAPQPSLPPSSNPGAGQTTSFTDLGQAKWAQSAIEELVAKGILKGVSENTFAPLKKVTRAEFTVMLVRALGLTGPETNVTFMDVKRNSWYSEAIASAVQSGVIQGTNGGKFEPGREITREEMAIMAARALKYKGTIIEAAADSTLASFKDQNKIASYAKEPVAQLIQAGILAGVGDGRFDAKGVANRAQAAVIISRLLKY